MLGVLQYGEQEAEGLDLCSLSGSQLLPSRFVGSACIVKHCAGFPLSYAHQPVLCFVVCFFTRTSAHSVVIDRFAGNELVHWNRG